MSKLKDFVLVEHRNFSGNSIPQKHEPHDPHLTVGCVGQCGYKALYSHMNT